jgi:hypothetical protein
MTDQAIDYRQFSYPLDFRTPAKGQYPFCIDVVSLSSNAINNLVRAQRLFNQLYASIAADPEFLKEKLAPLAARCEFIKAELAVTDQCENVPGKIKAVFGNNVFLFDGKKWTMTSANYLSAEAALHAHFYDELKREHLSANACGIFDIETLEKYAIAPDMAGTPFQLCSAPLDTYIDSIATAMSLTTHPSQRLHYLTRTFVGTKAIEIQYFCQRFIMRTGMPVSVISWDDIEGAEVDTSNRDAHGRGLLRLRNGEAVTAIFCRTELFGHPTSRFIRTPRHVWRDELEFYDRAMSAYQRIQCESSVLIMPTSGQRLARSRFLETSLTENLERFLSREDAEFLSTFFDRPMPLTDLSQLPRDRVAKNVLRGYYRPVQAMMEARAGGQRNDTPIVIRASSDQIKDAEFYTYKSISTPAWVARYVGKDGTPVSVGCHEGLNRSEFAVFGATISHPDPQPKLLNVVAGIGARTKPIVDQANLPDAGAYGAITAVCQKMY